MMKKRILYGFLILLAIILTNVHVVQAIEERSFLVSRYYDPFGRDQINAQLLRSTKNVDFYLDNYWYNSKFIGDKNKFLLQIYDLANEADINIIPILSKKLGVSLKFGPNQSSKLIVLLSPISQDVESYIRKDDGYLKKDYPQSNEAGIIYLNSSLVVNESVPRLSYYLSHELTHLATFELKEKIYNVKEDTWLNEARAEYVETLLGYDQNWANSNLKRRTERFLNLSSFSLLDWKNKPENYAIANFFMQYLVSQYGEKIWIETLKSPYTGIKSINEFLVNNGYKERFKDIFVNWLIASAVNDCSLEDKYCYKNPLLKNIIVFPANYYLPSQSSASLSVKDKVKTWGAKWQKIVGGNGSLKLEYTSYINDKFQVLPYIVIGQNGQKSIRLPAITYNNPSQIVISDFNGQNAALIFIPNAVDSSYQNTSANDYNYSWNALNLSTTQGEDAAKQEEQLMIEKLQQEVIRLQKILADLIQARAGSETCAVFTRDLSYGMTGDSGVKCLQQFLKDKYPTFYSWDITGNYFSLTQGAVIKYQALKGLPQTGYFGPMTQAKVNAER